MTEFKKLLRTIKLVSTATNSSKFLLLLHLYNAIQSEFVGLNDYMIKKIIN